MHIATPDDKEIDEYFCEKIYIYTIEWLIIHVLLKVCYPPSVFIHPLVFLYSCLGTEKFTRTKNVSDSIRVLHTESCCFLHSHNFSIIRIRKLM